MTKLVFDPETHRLLGAGIVGPRAGDLIAEATLALEMGCDAEDMALTIHPHPTLSETVMFAAVVVLGGATAVLGLVAGGLGHPAKVWLGLVAVGAALIALTCGASRHLRILREKAPASRIVDSSEAR